MVRLLSIILSQYIDDEGGQNPVIWIDSLIEEG